MEEPPRSKTLSRKTATRPDEDDAPDPNDQMTWRKLLFLEGGEPEETGDQKIALSPTANTFQ